MKQTIRIGRTTDNDKVYPQPDISAHHAVVRYLGGDRYEVEDLGSANGTYVNGVRIKKSLISSSDELRLSVSVLVNVASLFSGSEASPSASVPPRPQPLAPRAEDKTPPNCVKAFEGMRKSYEAYEARREAIQRQFQRRVLLIRAALTLIPLVLLTLFLHGLGAGIGMGLGMLANLFTINMSPKKELEELDNEFVSSYCCPNPSCRMVLPLGQSWSRLYAIGRCPRCNAIYNPKELTTK